MTDRASDAYLVTKLFRHISWRPRIEIPETRSFLEMAFNSSITRSCWRCVRATYSIFRSSPSAFGRQADSAAMVFPRPLLPSIRAERPFSTASRIASMNSP